MTVRPAHHPLQGIALLVAATGFLATLDTTFKLLTTSISMVVAIWFRYLFQAVAVSTVMLPRQGLRALRTAHPWLHVARGLLLLASGTLGFVSLRFMPLGEFTAIVMLTPLVVTLLAALFLGERVNALRWVLVAGGFAGAMLVVHPVSESTVDWRVLWPLSAVVVFASFQILTSRLARTENPMTMHFYTGWVGALVMTALLPWAWESVSELTTWGLLCLAGTVGTVGHFLVILAFGRAPAGLLAPYLYVQIGFAMLLGWLVFSHVPAVQELAGIGLIVACGATAAWLAARRPRVEV